MATKRKALEARVLDILLDHDTSDADIALRKILREMAKAKAARTRAANARAGSC